MVRLRLRHLSILAASGGAAFYATSPSPLHDVATIHAHAHGLFRSSLSLFTFGANIVDYKYSLYGFNERSKEYYEKRSQVHLRAARRILKLCEINRGFYIKAGQFIASLRQMPREYVATLSVLQDKAQPYPFGIVESLFEEEFGRSIFSLYKEFDKQPIGAASLAQVHHAVLYDGQDVAVKVQYPSLEQQFKVDILTMSVITKIFAWFYPDYQFGWIVGEFEKTMSKELDFEQEARNAERTARDFKNNKVLKVPHICWDLTTKKILTMQYMHGCKIDDTESLKRSGLDSKKVAKALIDVFAEMIFCHGYVHGDPHPGNILVHQRANDKGNQFHLVLLDHGLYRDLDEQFRLDFCTFWKALILFDPHELKLAGERLGAAKFNKFLPVIFAEHSLDSKASLGQTMSNIERKQLREEAKQFTAADISQFLEGLSRDFLVVLRTDGLLRSVTSKLGAEPRTRLVANAKYAIAGLSTTKCNSLGQPLESASWDNRIKAYLIYTNLRFRIELLEFHYKLKNVYSTILRAATLFLYSLERRVQETRTLYLNL